ncbi:hypothetical protein SELMODRAFT_405347 [Selaginella moellendorffii]|uniref:DUF4408 domain-containing protein n=1 Tax=Selaginella moellendorffii TaxID=88036 RepID=D8QX21_SELML|nr:hypothetical protein SELMODRAFT_405347 [Selaginella moellendorffii]
MLRSSWPLLLLAAMAALLVSLGSFDHLSLMAHRLSLDRLPHLRDSIFGTQPFLFLVLNSVIFAVLAPSGLFKDGCSSTPDDLPSSTPCSSRTSSLSRTDSMNGSSHSTTTAKSLEEQSSKSDTPAPEPDPAPASQPEDPIAPSSTADLSGPAPSPSTDSSLPVKEVLKKSPRPSNVSPPKSRVKRVKKMQKSAAAPSKQMVVPDIVEEHPKDPVGDPTDSLEDEDFKRFIDSFIAHTRHQMLLQEREYV